ncbi:MAG: PorV/PorQ family protein [Bacteroidota bacterium]|nr:PorV/PorQ family protein [Bacteroidota bacterium]
MTIKTKNIFRVAAVLLLSLSLLHGQDFKSNVSKKGTTAAPFLSIGQGARGLSMGSAFVAVADDPSSMYWNPAGIAEINGTAMLVDHTQWLADIQYNYLAGAMHLGEIGTLGVSFTSSNIGEMRVTTTDNPEGNGETFSVSNIAFSVGYAMKLTDRFSIGFNPKIVYQKIWKMSASAMAIDMGVKYDTPFDGVILGMSVSNFGEKMQMEGTSSTVLHDLDPSTTGNNGKIPANLTTEEWALPLNFKVGIAYKVLSDGTNKLTLAVDALHPNDNYESINVGGEYIFNDFLALRGGYKSMFLTDSQEGMTLGVGVRQAIVGNFQFTFDYAYQDFGILNNVQKFSIAIIF